MGAAEKIKEVAENTGQVKSLAGKYLTFRLANENYGLEILKVQEIIGILKVTRVPKMPEFVRGIVNLRGKLIPVIDMRSKFGLQMQEDTEKTCIIVVQFGHKEQMLTIGVIVDSVSEVLNIKEDQLEPSPSIGSTVETDFILSIGKVGEKVIILLDIDRVLTGEETHQLISAVHTK
jgi:purine-binding chemotaxis protein CheW